MRTWVGLAKMWSYTANCDSGGYKDGGIHSSDSDGRWIKAKITQSIPFSQLKTCVASNSRCKRREGATVSFYFQTSMYLILMFYFFHLVFVPYHLFLSFSFLVGLKEG